jgi:hypothetical protein
MRSVRPHPLRPPRRGHGRLLLAVVALAAHRAAPEPWTSTDGGAVAADQHGHPQCLVDDDAECPAASPVGPLVPPEIACASLPDAARGARLPGPPLYRLAPKNSPPVI